MQGNEKKYDKVIMSTRDEDSSNSVMVAPGQKPEPYVFTAIDSDTQRMLYVNDKERAVVECTREKISYVLYIEKERGGKFNCLQQWLRF